ncbi:uncharacterized protein GGS22DRAFT_199079 [Annulohypoxylon maeteangense]|uniref:uncharacterized protein n=1 Tax=Annulohypoxylon maeteangense TaxID=1927788 RepID=UPI0020076A51|nr:uncharacterized protein GGS22DRAFT_199079 [Annulohypoxylon maeteangense]KAI0886696.1 hypothetical protein GGS22DRAFT_199079 [Annulohypoxylon maeteangense]
MATNNHGHSIKSAKQIRYIIDHVFLPSQLPQEDDYEDKLEEALLQTVLAALRSFKDHMEGYEPDVLDSIINSLRSLQQSVSDEKGLLQAFDEFLIKNHGTVVFHVKEQNAGLMFTRSDASVHVEVFELSAKNSSVMSKKGRLRRVFPGSCSALPLETFQLPDFQASIAHTLVKMSHQRARDTKPRVKKAGKMQDEDRDTTHPKMVTDFFSSLVSYLGSPVQVDSICKHTREEVFWRNCKMPWHRSALWLLIRVALQLQFTRSVALHKCPEQAYKIFKIFFMTKILTRAHGFNLSSDLLSAMSSKLSRRCQKAAGFAPEYIVESVKSTLLATNHILKGRLSKIQEQSQIHVSHNMKRLEDIDLERDTHIRLPKLDDYIGCIDNRGQGSGATDLKISSPLEIHDSSQIPDFKNPLDNGDMTYTLAAVEFWVADSLPRWIKRNQRSSETCRVLQGLIVDYFKAARDHYNGNPEMTSIMILTLLELWVASDRSAVQNSLLLALYKPAIPIKLLENLNLPLREHMERLLKVERYLLMRRSQAPYSYYDIFQSFGTSRSFSVAYFDQSNEHRNLLLRIEEDALAAREEKRQEFRAARQKFEDLMQRSRNSEHKYTTIVDQKTFEYSDHHNKHNCPKCELEQEALDMEIGIHEWPLPDDELRAKSTVFELWVPPFFGHWRDTTMFIWFDVLGSRYQARTTEQSRNTLDDPLVTRYFEPFSSDQRIILMSGAKSNTRTHRKLKELSTHKEDDVCLRNGLNYKYFDDQEGCFVTQLETTEVIPKLCTYCISENPTKQVSPIQQFINRPASDPHGPPPNTVLASQSECPGDVSLEEYKALASLPLGSSIQWQNLLVQLAMPSINFKMEDTILVILQCIFQVGRRDDDSVLRMGHKVLGDKIFVRAMLSCLDEALGRIKENWQSFQALGVFVSISRRLLSLAPAEVSQDCLKFLTATRYVALRWIQILDEKIQSATDNGIRKDLRYKVSRIALICGETFNIDNEHLRNLLASPHDACIMIRCAIVFQGVLSHVPKTEQGLDFIMRQRWDQLSYRSFSILSEQITHHHNPALNDAIKETWPAFRPINAWHVMGQPFHHWIETNSAREEGPGSLSVHFSLLTGELLIDGSPLGRLPKKYQRHHMHSTLFGKSILDVRPSAVPGMRFASKKAFHGHLVDFGMNNEDLYIRAVIEDQILELIPRTIFQGFFPTVFVDNFVHWYNKSKGYVEFCSQDHPWDHSESNWKLVRSGSTWKLVKGDSILVNLGSYTALRISDILDHLEEAPWIHFILRGSTLDIELPRLKLGFFTKKGEMSIFSRQFRGMVIDGNQSIGTLIGLKTKLVLRGQNDGIRRKVIIPSGKIMFSKKLEHVEVQIEHRPSTRAHLYEIDDLLGRLINNSSLQSKLLISYLHGLTSFPFPDPLTKKTGTENALNILDCAAVQSFKCLTEEDIDLLQQIAALTPERVYYPEHEHDMQSVNWSPDLGFLSQHGEFFRKVRSIYRQATESKFLYPESRVTLPELHDVNDTLLDRDLVRSSLFHVVGSGAENYTKDDDVDYEARDRGELSSQASQAVALSSMLFGRNFSLRYKIPQDVKTYIWNFVSLHATKKRALGPSFTVSASQLMYDSGLLLEPFSFIAEHWIPLHILLSSDNKPNKFQMMFWLGTIAYAKDVDLTILQILASFYADSRMASIGAPNIHKFDLTHGFNAKNWSFANIIKDCSLGYPQSPEVHLPKNHGETKKEYSNRRGRQYRAKNAEAVKNLESALKAQWPCEVPTRPSATICEGLIPYIDVDRAINRVKDKFRLCYNNHQLMQYFEEINGELSREKGSVKTARRIPLTTLLSPTTKWGFIGDKDVFDSSAPTGLPDMAEDVISLLESNSTQTPRLPSLLSRLGEQAQSGYENDYVEDLGSSVESLKDWRKEYKLSLSKQEIEDRLNSHQEACQAVVDEIYTKMCEVVKDSLRDRHASSQHWPRISPIFFLERLSHRYWNDLPEGWKTWIVHYGVAISRLQRAQRLLRAIHNEPVLIKELQNPGHTNWNPIDQPDSLLLEIESDIMIREVQAKIAARMRSPKGGGNSVMQLNMGEGKSSVIVPAVAAALADGKQLVRVIVGKPQSKQMFQMLVSKLGGLLGRRIYHLPFSRAVKIEGPELKAISKMFNSCKDNGGVFLVQPEHILSFKLMGIECILTEKEKIGHSLTQLQNFLDSRTRDIVDESDENFSVKFELVYTMGNQEKMEFSPDRWICIQQLLDIVRTVISEENSKHPDSIELHFQAFGCFPWTRIINPDAVDRTLHGITEQICALGFNGFPITRQPELIRRAVETYITKKELTPDIIALIEDGSPSAFWTGAKDTLLLLRGLIAGGVLAFAFGHKRWRVDYGLDANRSPTTKLAVPYRAKDSPSPRSEFSHPDVVIILTSLSYYYGGLSDEDLFLAFNHLLKSDQAELEYGLWARAANDLGSSFRQLVGINLEDSQCTEHVFKNLRFVKEVIDYFLAHIVFPKEMKEFRKKLSASGWDLGEEKTHPTTGFSGTNDSRKVLPLHVEQLDLSDQKHTNALVLEYLLQPENSVELIPRRDVDVSVADMLLNTITKMDPPTRVILDVGAQILELDNLGVATTWLQRNSDNGQIQAAVYFDDHDEICVLDRKGHSEPFQTSPYATQLDACLVFLDEAHTRGTDLKLPKDYRAAVTLGANLTKDRLVQACMRMRMLGEGQSVVFCVPEEIQAKIRTRRSALDLASNGEISVLDILAWTIGETWQDIHRSMGLWANQGRRHEKHLKLWETARALKMSKEGVAFEKDLAERYLEEESQTLERRYRPRARGTNNLGISSENSTTDPISRRCMEFTNLNLDSATLQEEEERELSPEVEQEREVQGPTAAEPATHFIHQDVRSFISHGTANYESEGYRRAFVGLRDTTAGALFDVDDFQSGLLASMDFERTIEHHHNGSDVLDFYQRTVQWILTSGPNDKVVKHMMVISPYEAQVLLPEIQASEVAALHLYAPQSSLGYRRLDTLDLYTVPERLSRRQIPQRLITELNLFAGQLYFDSFEQYVDACKFMGISYNTRGEGEEIAADGFILRDALARVGGESGLRCSPVKFFKVLHTKIRRNCESISKTHMGKLLDNQLLMPEDFESDG